MPMVTRCGAPPVTLRSGRKGAYLNTSGRRTRSYAMKGADKLLSQLRHARQVRRTVRRGLKRKST
jgi:hypothetical protein